MTGFALAFGSCVSCRETFGFNPVRVPSIRIAGEREPICRKCVDRINPHRRRNGLPEIVPAPDAYEACEESELS